MAGEGQRIAGGGFFVMVVVNPQVVSFSTAAQQSSTLPTNQRVPLSGPEARGRISIAQLTQANGTRSIFIELQTECYDDCFGKRT